MPVCCTNTTCVLKCILCATMTKGIHSFSVWKWKGRGNSTSQAELKPTKIEWVLYAKVYDPFNFLIYYLFCVEQLKLNILINVYHITGQQLELSWTTPVLCCKCDSIKNLLWCFLTLINLSWSRLIAGIMYIWELCFINAKTKPKYRWLMSHVFTSQESKLMWFAAFFSISSCR